MIRLFTFSPSRSLAGTIAFAIAGLLAPPGSAAASAPPPEEMFKPPVPYLSPEESLEHFHLPDGYRLELVVSEPEIREPVAVVFDGNGRMYVAEMRSYMQDIDGTDSRAPVGRVSVHWSSRDDGLFDQHEVFIDDLVLPRMMLPLDGSLLVSETDTNDIYEYRDTTGDHRADERTLFYDAEPSRSNLEHQTSGLIWAADNWIYTTYNPFRLRWTPEGRVKQEPTAPNAGQWGLTQDNYGKPWFVNAGGEHGPINFQQPIVYGGFRIEGEFEPGFKEVFPLVPIPDVEGGEPRFRPDQKTLNHFTATCGPVIFRGDRLPSELAGNLLFGEPVGRLIRRAIVEVRDGVTSLRNAHPRSEFIRSTDPNFRPVNMENGPDGTLYIVDMYRGIIQEADWVREGSYLREVIKEYGLQNNYGRGRIWRLVHEDHQPAGRPRMLDENAGELVSHLAHPNGWWRDTAQKLLVLRQDLSVVDDLKKMARSHRDPLARFHAIWTLEGLAALDPAFLHNALADENPQVRTAAIRASESLFKGGDDRLRNSIRQRLGDPDPTVVTQAMLTASHLNWTDAVGLIQETQAETSSRGVREIARQLLQARGEPTPLIAQEHWELFDRGRTIYNQLCFSCHAADGHGTRVQLSGKNGLLAPPLAGSTTLNDHPGASIRVLLHGLTGPIDGETYPGEMVEMGANEDEWIAAVLTYVRNSFGNRSRAVLPEDVAHVRQETAGRDRPWTIEEIRQATPRLLQNREEWILTASHNQPALRAAVDANLHTRYTSRSPRSAGSWVQVELPEETYLTILEIDSSLSPDDYSPHLRIELSRDGEHWTEAEITQQELAAVTRTTITPAPARFVRLINQDDHPRFWWSIHDLRIYESRG